MMFGSEITATATLLAPLERVERSFLRRLLLLSNPCLVAMLYLETGLLPIAFVRLQSALTY